MYFILCWKIPIILTLYFYVNKGRVSDNYGRIKKMKKGNISPITFILIVAKGFS